MSKLNKISLTAARIAKLLLALTFIFSGFTKAVDPFGTAYKLADYLTMIFELPQVSFLSFFLAVSLIMLEFTLGFMLLTNLFVRTAARTVLALLILYSITTIYLINHNLFNDCGCFGDAIKFSGSQTLCKNLILFLFALLVLKHHSQFKTYVNKEKCRYSWVMAAAFFILIFEFYNYSFLPVIDFRPFKIGTNIWKSMQVPASAPKNEYKTTLYYRNKKTGKIEKFNDTNFPWNDTLWEWVDTEVKLVKKGYVPPIDNFQILTLAGKDITDSILRIKEPVLLIIAYDLNKTHIRPFTKIVKFSREFTQKYHKPAYCLTASSYKVIDSIKHLTGAYDIEFCNTDETTLKTMIRANPGIIVLRDGIIIDKRHYNTIPKLKKIDYANKNVRERKTKYDE